MSKKYRVLHGVEFVTKAGKTVRIEPGTVTDDIPRESIPWLVEQHHIEEIEDDPQQAKQRTREVKAMHGPPEDKMFKEQHFADKGEGLIQPPVDEEAEE
jgi:hypothetical protein